MGVPCPLLRYALAFVADHERSADLRFVPLPAAAVTLGSGLLFLVDQHLFNFSYLLDYLVSGLFLLMLLASIVAYWDADNPLDQAFRKICLWTFLTSLLVTIFLPNHFFLSLVWSSPPSNVPSIYQLGFAPGLRARHSRRPPPLFAAVCSHPEWFVDKTPSASGRRSPWGISTPLALVLFLLAFWLFFGPRHLFPGNNTGMYAHDCSEPITHDSIDQADAIVEGNFILNRIISRSSEVLVLNPYQQLDVNTFVIPVPGRCGRQGRFVGGAVRIKIFFPEDGASPVHWGLPLKERLLLFLKKDPQEPGVF